MPGVSPRLKRTAHRIFLAGDRLGVHIIPRHYYSPVASPRLLRRSEREWRRRVDPLPFEWDIDAQAQWIAEQALGYPKEMPLEQVFRESERVGGMRYGPIESQFLYSWVRRNAPANIVEIGSGSSTLLMSMAAARNVEEGRAATAITAYDPYTAQRLVGLPHVVARPVGGLSLTSAHVDMLGAGDLLFIDSTHTVRTGSEVPHLYLELVPNLAPGVVVHIHDVYLPYLFAPGLYESMFDWQETTLVAALLAGNPGLRILASQSGLFHDRPDALAAAFPEFTPIETDEGIAVPGTTGHFPSSLWLLRT